MDKTAERQAEERNVYRLQVMLGEALAENAELMFWLRKAGNVLAPHSADRAGTPTRDALVFVNAALHPQARERVRAILQEQSNAD